MKAGWELKTLNEVCIVERGSSPRPIKDFFTTESDGVNWIKIGDTEQDGRYVFSTAQKITAEGAKQSRFVKEGDFILTNSMSFGRPYIMKTSGYIHDGWFVFRLKESLDADYFYHLLSSPFVQNQFQNLASGAIVKNISGDLVKQTKLPIPPIPEQQRIVTILDEAFENIATAKVNAQQNLKNARELFESYLQSVFSQRGEGWVEKPLGEIADLIDSLHKTPSYTNEGYSMVRVTDIKPGILNLSKTRKVDQLTFLEFSKRHTPKKGDIVFSRVGTYGVSALVDSDQVFCLGQNTVFIIPKINSQLLFDFLGSPCAREQIDSFVDGTTQPTISLKSIKQIIVPIPPLHTQNEIIKRTQLVAKETQHLESIYQQKIVALDELKKSLLHKAFSGEL